MNDMNRTTRSGAFRRAIRLLVDAAERQSYLYERYFEALGTSGSQARAALNRSRDELQLERTFNAPAIGAGRRSPAPPE